ncbi:flavocytochrome c [Fusibacter bizertensis]|uniref:Flavocytochrome c n=1 Tax=Fusibacter bizertensis TaxID=1488331 RepID=A0ABT6N9A3_9FIRM|nr:flavocytochrome c [Fusibacter bizertensis]MDH8677001.1 flavocytochrome c [Fusibacter bizertensis]
MSTKNRIAIVVSIISVIFIGGFITYTLLRSDTVTDVVVIGAGASGMSAAIEAADAGFDVILLEKMPYVGGNTARATAGINIVGSPFQDEMGIVDSKELFVNDVLVSGHSLNNKIMVEKLANESSDALNWLDNMGADLTDIGILAGHAVPRTLRPSGGQPVGSEIVRVLKKNVDEKGIDLRLENKAISILTEASGEVSGVSVVDRSGRTYTIHAKNVIIATGGFGGSPEMYVYYNQELKGYKTTNSPSATGDFITLVAPLDVKLVDMSYIQTHPTVSYEYGMLITEAIRGNGGILINNKGLRFSDELENRDLLSADILSQPDQEVYLVFNEEIKTSLASSSDYINMDIILSADTLDSLAEQMRIDKQTFQKTIVNYNQFVAQQSDTDFGRRSLERTLESGKYYAIQVIPGVHYCMGGILIDDKARAIDSKGQIIKGLYASGEATGGIHGLNRLGGNSLLDAVVFGRIAGRLGQK